MGQQFGLEVTHLHARLRGNHEFAGSNMDRASALVETSCTSSFTGNPMLRLLPAPMIRTDPWCRRSKKPSPQGFGAYGVIVHYATAFASTAGTRFI